MKPLEISAEDVKRAGGDVGAAVRLHSAGIHPKGELDGASEKRVMAEIIAALEAKGYRRPSHWEPGTKGIYMRVGQARADKGGPHPPSQDERKAMTPDHKERCRSQSGLAAPSRMRFAPSWPKGDQDVTRA